MVINTEEVKEEVLQLGKWTRLIFMIFYAFVLNFVVSVVIAISFIQFLFYLFTSKDNETLSDINQHLFLFVSDTLKFLLFDTDIKPFPFNGSGKKDNSGNLNQVVDIEANEVVDMPDNDIEFSEVVSSVDESIESEEVIDLTDNALEEESLEEDPKS